MRPFFAGVGAILMLHHVRPGRADEFQPNQLLEVTPEFLEQTVAWLREQEIDIISLDEMHRRLRERDFGRRFACITLDDGYRDNKVFAYPIFKRYEAPFTIFVPTSFPEHTGRLWWLALELVIARNDAIAFRIGEQEEIFTCTSARRKSEVYNRIYWRLRELPSEDAIDARIDELAARYGIDMQPLREELCMDWDEVRALAADPLATIGAHTVNHVML